MADGQQGKPVKTEYPGDCPIQVVVDPIRLAPIAIRNAATGQVVPLSAKENTQPFADMPQVTYTAETTTKGGLLAPPSVSVHGGVVGFDTNLEARNVARGIYTDGHTNVIITAQAKHTIEDTLHGKVPGRTYQKHFYFGYNTPELATAARNHPRDYPRIPVVIGAAEIGKPLYAVPNDMPVNFSIFKAPAGLPIFRDVKALREVAPEDMFKRATWAEDLKTAVAKANHRHVWGELGESTYIKDVRSLLPPAAPPTGPQIHLGDFRDGLRTIPYGQWEILCRGKSAHTNGDDLSEMVNLTELDRMFDHILVSHCHIPSNLPNKMVRNASGTEFGGLYNTFRTMVRYVVAHGNGNGETMQRLAGEVAQELFDANRIGATIDKGRSIGGKILPLSQGSTTLLVLPKKLACMSDEQPNLFGGGDASAAQIIVKDGGIGAALPTAQTPELFSPAQAQRGGGNN